MSFIVKNTTMISIFDLLAPHSCRGCGRIGEPICNRCKNYIIKQHQNFCPFCKQAQKTQGCSHCTNSLPAFYTVSFRQKIMSEAIRDLKYSSVRALIKPLAQILNQILPQNLENIIIVPLPTIDKHIRERGLDHTKLIAQQLISLRKNWKVKKILLRNQNTTQVGTNRKTRINQADLAYRINPKIKINPNKTYLIFDDVWTTGASMMSAVKKLRQAGAKKIVIATLAVSE